MVRRCQPPGHGGDPPSRRFPNDRCQRYFGARARVHTWDAATSAPGRVIDLDLTRTVPPGTTDASLMPTGVKIDRGFVAGLGTNAEDEEIVRAVAAMSVALGLTVVAEGVESPVQRAHSTECMNNLRQIRQAYQMATATDDTKPQSLADLKPQGQPMVALDAIGAGVGELVFWCRGKEASFPFKREDTPTDCTIVGIVDSEGHVSKGRRRR